jgi:hypothetical protein
MSEIETGGPAFPVPVIADREGVIQRADAYVDVGGMTLRDYFAAKAMQATIIAAGSWGPCNFRDFDVDAVSEFAHRQADAMLAARSKP